MMAVFHRSLSRRVLLGVLAAITPFVVCSAAPPVAPADFKTSVDLTATNADGTPDVQAGSHPYELTTTITFKRGLDPFGHVVTEGGSVKDIEVELPPGLLANAQATPKCSMHDFGILLLGPALCPPETQIGVIYLELLGFTEASGSNFSEPDPLYNLTPPAGKAVAFGYKVATANLAMTAALRTGGDYGATVSQTDISQFFALLRAKIVIWGVPGDPRHNPLRRQRAPDWEQGEPSHAAHYGAPFLGPVLPFLRLPTQCQATGEGMVTGIRTDSWQDPGQFATSQSVSHLSSPDESVTQGLMGCKYLDFKPSVSVQPDTYAPASPMGFTVDIHVPQSEVAGGLVEADLRKAVFTLPAGVTISPSSADGLGACTVAEIGLGSSARPGCPDNSKVGDVEVTTQLLETPLRGGVYIAQPYENPFDSLFALYVTMEEPQTGVLVKLAGRVSPDPVTGQLTVIFDKNPPLPFTDFKMKMVGGARATLSSPPSCGTFTTSTQLTPWSSEVPVAPSDSFTIKEGVRGAPCMNPLPFAPGFSAGTVNPLAGAFTPFVMSITREDGQQTLAGKFQLQTPPGLLGMLSSVKLCKEPAASQGTCGPDSAIGHVTVGSGPGPQPYYVHGTIYLTESYKGAPFGLSIVVPAIAGPFNLGNVVVRAAINIDPGDSHLYITTEPMPTVLDGIPIQVRSINATVNREHFIFNPTSCASMSVKSTIASAEGLVSTPSVRFHAGYCSTLAFKPSFKVATTAHVSRTTGASLDAKLSFPAGREANLARVKVDLPRQLPSRLTTLQHACSDAVFKENPDMCPAASRIGYARVSTPVLPEPLAGPVFFISHGGAAFPDLVIVLQGDGVRVDVVGATNIVNGITSTSFRAVQDVPISSFELYLPQGPGSALGVNGNLCAHRLVMPTAFIAQNGAQIHQATPIAVRGCRRSIRTARKAAVRGRSAGHNSVTADNKKGGGR